GFNKSLKIIKKLLRGKGFKQALKAKGVQSTSTRSRSVNIYDTWDTRDQYFFPIKFAPACLMKDFAEWVWENCHEFKDPQLKSFATIIFDKCMNLIIGKILLVCTYYALHWKMKG
ncbi:MAG: hypothetical protein ACTMIA_16385, partial [Vibrio sp.]